MNKEKEFQQNTIELSDAAVHDAVTNPQFVMPEWTAKRVMQATLAALGVGIAFFLLYRFYMVVFMFFAAVTLQIAMKPGVEWLRRRGLRTEFSVALIYLIFLIGVVGVIWLAAPLLFEQTGAVVQQIPEFYDNWRVSILGAGNRLVRAFAMALPQQLSLADLNATSTVDESTLNAMTPVWQTIKNVSYIFFILIAILMLAYYWVLENDMVTRRLLFYVPSEQRPRWRAILSEMEDKIGSYFRGQLILCLIVGLLSIVGYFAIGLPYAFGLGILMGLFEAIPMIGPILGAVPAVLVALTTAPDKILWVIGVVALIQLLENNLLVPKIMDKSVGVHAIVTILAIAAFGLLFGFGGAILAIPLAAVLQIFFNHFVLNISPTEENMVEASNTNVAGRSRVSTLRLQAQDFVNDIQKKVRKETDSEPVSDATEQIEDLLEAIAEDLDSILDQMEQTA
ncbi:MAG: AI-2E family transporter [Caldilineaceae bacterium]|nr:AI-2E family transporter [Caldilineaceae bacterium]MCB0095587.1 AI-2E family transporter [Caldilineaceae bacterium]